MCRVSIFQLKLTDGKEVYLHGLSPCVPPPVFRVVVAVVLLRGDERNPITSEVSCCFLQPLDFKRTVERGGTWKRGAPWRVGSFIILLTSQLNRIPSSMPIRGSYPRMYLALSPQAYRIAHASWTLPRLRVVEDLVAQVANSHINPATYASAFGIWISKGGTCPNCAQMARQKSRNVIGSLFWMKNASPAAVRDVVKFSAARTWASATLLTWVTSHRLNPSPMMKGVSYLAIHA
jgi:hypothetical protein